MLRRTARTNRRQIRSLKRNDRRNGRYDVSRSVASFRYVCSIRTVHERGIVVAAKAVGLGQAFFVAEIQLLAFGPVLPSLRPLLHRKRDLSTLVVNQPILG